MRPRSVPAPLINCITNEPMLYKEPSIMESMYIPNNPQYGLQLEYTTTAGPGQYPVYQFNGDTESDQIQFNGYTVSSPVQICVNNDDNGENFEEVTNVLCDDNNQCIVDVSDLRHHQLHHTECACPTTDSVDNLCSEQHHHHHHHQQNIDEELQCHQNNSDLELCNAANVQGISVSSVSGGICGNTQIYSSGLNNSVAQQLSTSSSVGPYWATDVDMGTFSLPPLDLDPLPSLFPFSPCSANNFKSECINGGGVPTGTTGSNLLHHHHHHGSGIVKQPHDMADVLLSLKHAVVHPGQQSATSPQGGSVVSIGNGVGGAPLSPPNFTTSAAYPQQSQLSYSMHPHQMLMSPTAYPTSFCDQSGMFGPTNGNCQGHQQSGMFPSMSVNVSMNMTMHGYPPPYPETIQHQVTCPQMQWSTSPQNTSPTMYHQQAQGILSPSYTSGGTTYSFTADFRTPSAGGPGIGDNPLITTSSSFKPVLNKNSSTFSQLAAGLRSRRQSLGYSSLSPTTNSVIGGPTKIHTGALSSEDESQRPNLCRICGKTYARPSTLKTHLRTHSGEKPYRCSDCNKSFSQAANLTAHVRTHSGEKPFRCPICDRRFSQSSSVTTHMRTHSGERPYRCRMCKKAFSDSSTLTKHLRIHSGEKPYQCKLCLLRFSQSGNLNRHMRVHGTTNNGATMGTTNHHQMLGTAG